MKIVISRQGLTIAENGKTKTLSARNSFYKKATKWARQALAEDMKETPTLQKLRGVLDDPTKKTASLIKQIDPELTESNMPKALKRMMLAGYRSGTEITALVNFWKRTQKNPSTDSQRELFLFLQENEMPLLPDGRFLAYKGVCQEGGNFMDIYTRTIRNNLGDTPSMPREAVNADRNVTCSHGLHVAAWDYAKSYFDGVMIEVAVAPEDVVSVPNDYNNQKMRTCRYEVIGIRPQKPTSCVFFTEAQYRIRYTLQEAKMTRVKKAAGKNATVDLTLMSAREILQFVKEKTGVDLPYSPKSKQTIIRHGKEALMLKEMKSGSATDIVNGVQALTGEKIEISKKNKKAVVRKANLILQEYGFKVRI